MRDLIDIIDKDISRCKYTIKKNNYLEIVITIEELYDKYECSIDAFSDIEKDKVWNYSKEDILIMLEHLKEYKFRLLRTEKYNRLNNKLIALKTKISDDEKDSKEIILRLLSVIESTYNQDISLDDKWNILKNSLGEITFVNRTIAIYFMDIYRLILEE